MNPHFVSFLKIILCLFALCAWQGVYATPTTPTSDFTDNGDGTVTHKTTGLIWQRCAVGQTWTGSDCSGEAKTFTYAEAMALKSNFAGQSDWRLPSIAELHTIVERENVNPAINNTIFPDTPPSAFWSSSPYANYSSYAWVVNFSYGYDSDGNKSNYNFVRLVRGGQWIFGSLPLTTPTADFVNNGNGTVTHKRTGLMWQQCAVGQTRTDSNCSGTAGSYTYYNAMKLTSNFAGYSDWRLPTADELQSIVEYGKYNPSINSSIFPNTPNDWFWSSSPNANDSDDAWIVNFKYGSGSNGSEGSSYFVRLVRGGQGFLGSLPNGVLAKAWLKLGGMGEPFASYMGVTAYMNNSDGSGDYDSTELAVRFATNVLHLANLEQTDGKQFADANKDKTGYIEWNGQRTDIVSRYYPSGSSKAPINGALISQTSHATTGQVSIVKKIVEVNKSTLDVYLFEQNWLFRLLKKGGDVYIANSRKMRFSKNAKGQWTGKTSNSNVAVGWLNPEAK